MVTYDIPGYPGYKLTDDYQIIGKRGRPMSFTDSGQGHLFCNVFANGKSSLLYLHRAIALVHVKGYFVGAVVDHIDRNPANNHPSNLRWVTVSANAANSGPSVKNIDERLVNLNKHLEKIQRRIFQLETIKAALNI